MPTPQSVFDMELERTEFSDDSYAMIGRALTYAQKFEGDCLGLNTLWTLKPKVKAGELSLDDDEAMAAFVMKVRREALACHLQQLVEYTEETSFRGAFDKARDSRNHIAHELCLGIQYEIETDRGRERLVKELEEAIRNISEAHLIVLILMAGEHQEPLPTRHYLASYADRVVEWACSTED